MTDVIIGEDAETGFRERFKQARERAKLSAVQLAKAIEVTSQAIWNYENRPGGISSDKLFRVADALGVSARWLATGVEDGIVGDAPPIDPSMHPAICQALACLEASLAQENHSRDLVKAALSILKCRREII